MVTLIIGLFNRAIYSHLEQPRVSVPVTVRFNS